MPIKPPYNNPYGIWTVRTEGDCEGKTMQNLGTFSGYIDDIALYLADSCYYSLQFSPFNIQKIDDNFTPTHKQVNVTLDIHSGTWNMNPNFMALNMEKVFKDRPVYIKESRHGSGSFVIETIKETKEEKKKKALAKLTPEERKLLGLE